MPALPGAKPWAEDGAVQNTAFSALLFRRAAAAAGLALVLTLGLGPGLSRGAPAPDAGDVAHQARFAQQVLARVNAYRGSRGLGLLQPDAALARIAAEHSQRMAQRQRIGHDGFAQRFERTGRRLCVETLAADFDQEAALLAGWLASPAHHDKLLEPQVRDVGVASVGGYVTLLACE